MISTEPDRSRLLAHRRRAHQLTGPAAAPADCTVLGVGVRDNPVGGTAALALRARTEPTGDAEDGLIRAYSVRSAVHLHRRADLPLLIAALRWQGSGEAARGNFGDLAVPDPAAAVAQVAAAMSKITGDGEPRTKGELSGAVTARLDPDLSPWCASCKAHHVNDGLFRQATLQARLVVVPEPAGSFRLHPYDSVVEVVEPTEARRELLRRYLHLAGPATPAAFGTWLGLGTAAARAWWDLLADELEPVRLDGLRCWLLAGDLAALPEPAEPEISVVPPYDPYLEVAERKFLVADPARRSQVWRAVRNPGVVLRGGEVIGTWRDRKSGSGRVVTLDLFVSPSRSLLPEIERRLQRLLPGARVETQRS
ncbi:winged helix DNA-binding domain-containing protein [Microlunatus sp. GCM10028923]|uniref:winged helix DNA-binding domain-containing protein n=1 Tax=Microlunatus sp. GCM10028923 TaxID=3273400 RepID=UPI00361F5905